MKRVLLLDNYDSFTYNLEHLLLGMDAEVSTVRNDAFNGDLLNYSHIVLSPGPGLPKHAGKMMDLIQATQGKIPILGVCLGMQGIAEYLGGSLYNQTSVKHGVMESVELEDTLLFKDMEREIEVGLYHSWSVNADGDYDVIAYSKSGIVMAIQNQSVKMLGVQFHPESVMTPSGKQVLNNFLAMH